MNSDMVFTQSILKIVFYGGLIFITLMFFRWNLKKNNFTEALKNYLFIIISIALIIGVLAFVSYVVGGRPY